MSEVQSDSFMVPLTRSMGLVLEEFYNTMRTVGVSAATGEGIGDLIDAIQDAKAEYFSVFLESIRSRREEKKKADAAKKAKQMKKMEADLEPEDKSIQEHLATIANAGEAVEEA